MVVLNDGGKVLKALKNRRISSEPRLDKISSTECEKPNHKGKMIN